MHFNADKTLYGLKIYRNFIKIHQIDEVQKDVQNASKTWLPIETKLMSHWRVGTWFASEAPLYIDNIFYPDSDFTRRV